MNGSVPEKPSDPYLYEPADDWLYWSMVKVNRIPWDNPIDIRLCHSTRMLLRSIEAELLPTPSIWRGVMGQIHIKFTFGSRSVEFVVTPMGYYSIRTTSNATEYEVWPYVSCKGWPGQFARDEILFACPAVNMSDDKSMIATSRERQ